VVSAKDRFPLVGPESCQPTLQSPVCGRCPVERPSWLLLISLTDTCHGPVAYAGLASRIELRKQSGVFQAPEHFQQQRWRDDLSTDLDRAIGPQRRSTDDLELWSRKKCLRLEARPGIKVPLLA